MRRWTRVINFAPWKLNMGIFYNRRLCQLICRRWRGYDKNKFLTRLRVDSLEPRGCIILNTCNKYTWVCKKGDNLNFVVLCIHMLHKLWLVRKAFNKLYNTCGCMLVSLDFLSHTILNVGCDCAVWFLNALEAKIVRKWGRP